MGEDLDLFIIEQRAKLAEDKANLERDPPYMEIRVSICIVFITMGRCKKINNSHGRDSPANI